MRGRNGGLARILPFLFLFAILSTGAAFAQDGQNAKVLVVPFSVSAGEDLSSVKISLQRLLIESLEKEGVNAAAGKGAPLKTPAAAVKAALAAKATHAVYGGVSKLGDSVSVDAHVVATANAEPLAVYATADLVNLQGAADELAAKIKANMYSSDRIAEVDVEGNNVLDKEVVLLKIKSRAGQMYNPKTVNQDLKRLFELGYFDDVQIRLDDSPAGKRLVFVVKEKPRIQAIGVTGSGDIDKDEILEVMSTKTGSILNLKVLADDLEKIRELYKKDGYYKTEVTYNLEQTDPRVARLNIIIKEPKKLYIKDVKIEGAEQEDPDDLRSELATKERTFYSWITGDGVLKEDYLERDAAALEAFYANRGFIDAKVGQPEVEYGDDGITVIFRVVEGDRYRVGEVKFTGDLLLEDPVLMEMIKLDELSEEHEYFDRSVVRNDLNALTEVYSDYGYAFAEADVDMEKIPEEKLINLTYVLYKGKKVYVRRVLIEGNTKTRDNVIRREMKLADGDLFSGSKLRRSNERLDKLDYFEKIDIETLPTDNPTEIDLKVKVKDKNTGSISLGAGYSTYDSVFFGGSVEERNLFGKGYHVKFQGMFSGRTSRFVLSFTNPHVYDSKLASGVELYNMFKSFDDFDKETVGGKITFGYPVGEYTLLTAEYRLDRYRLYNVNAFASQEILSSAGTKWSSSVYLEGDRDTTDSATKPTKGTKNTLSVEYAGGVIGGDDDFIKPLYTFNYFRPLLWDWVFHFRGHGGVIMENGGTVPVFERFYLGGINNVRGYALDKISPKDPWTGERIGGKAVFYTNIETIFPIDQSNGIMGVVFFDAGNSWREVEDVDGDLYKAVGIGLRWYSPMGLIRVEYGYGLDADRHDLEPNQVGFSMGQTF